MDSGIRDANLVASVAKQHLPDNYLIYSSIGKRAFETALIFANVLDIAASEIIILEELYTFDGTTLERIIKAMPNAHDNIMLFGHNEAITDFVNKFGDIYIDNVPTAGFVTITFDTDSWNNLSKGHTGKIIFPRDLRS